jgi:hypothetical protein
MCGILWVDSKRGMSAVKPLIKRYRKQDHRGKSGYGYVAVDANGFVGEIHRSTDEDGIMEALASEQSSKILFHHRSPTSLPNYVGATHPFKISKDDFDFDYYIVHNGVIANAEFLFGEYKKAGIKFMSEMAEGKYHEFVNTDEYYEDLETKTKVNDSEVFAVDMAAFIEGKQTWVKSAGTIAFIGLQVFKNGKDAGKVNSLFWGRNNGNPVCLEEDNVLFTLSSEAGGKEVDADKIYFKNWQTGEITTKQANGIAYHGFSTNASGIKNVHKTKAERKAERCAARKAGQSNGLPEDAVILYDGGPNEPEPDPEIDDAVARMTGTRIESHPSFDWIETLKATQDQDVNLKTMWGLLPTKSKLLAAGAAEQVEDMTLIDIGIDLNAIDNEIEAADMGRGDADAGLLRQLRDDLQDDLDSENDALRELRSAQELLREAVQAKPFILKDSEEAKAMVDAASSQWGEAHNARIATCAELEAHMGAYGGW